MEKALADHGIATIPDGKKFMLLVPESLRSTITPSVPDEAEQGTNSETIPPGLIDFQGVDAAQLADIYAKLMGGEIDRSAPFPPGNYHTIYFECTTPLTKAEAIYACKTLLMWEKLKLEPSGNRLFQVVSVAQ